ncbi:hypothetical protein SLS62_004189 [Diatrype stigma]|uniref:Uncharacterized protein n=1 Tax=Diatrype stigma TaxID=117547 RepID=A0AAN9UTN9_9PEZI
MLASVLKSIGDSSTESEGIAELVVTAIGTGGRHYLCWKTPSGSYRQHHHGLPSALEEWLFPADGSTRDFETLQVILSGENTFWASDRHGEIKSRASDQERRLRRATTINSMTPTTESKRWTGYVVGMSPDNAERKRSTTLPSMPPVSDQTTEVPAGPRSRHIRSLSSTDGPHRAPHEELGPLKECPSPLPQGPAPLEPEHTQPSRNSQCSCGCHEGVRRSGQPPLESPADAPHKKARPVYADAGIQTDDDYSTKHPSKASTRHEDGVQRVYGRQRRARSTEPSSGFEFQPDTYSSQRASLYSSGSWESDRSSWYLPNPVMMGRMQDYFRSTDYYLGDSLQPQGMG